MRCNFLLKSFLILAYLNSVEAKTLDFSNISDPTGEYEVALCARPSPSTPKNLPGHAFVSFTHTNNTGQVSVKSIGHTTNVGALPALLSYFGTPVSGYLSEEKYTSTMEKCLRIKVNKPDFQRALSHTENPLYKLGIGDKNDPVLRNYSLGENDCMNFMVEVAKELTSLGLKIPDRKRAEKPLNYLERVLRAN